MPRSKRKKKKVEKTPQEKRLEGLFRAMQEAGIKVERIEEIWEFFPLFIYEKLEEKGDAEAIEWNVEDVKEYITRCRVDDWGNPSIQTGFAKQEFSGKKVMVKCVGGFDKVKDHEWFKNVPDKLIEMIEGKGTWKNWARWMLKNGNLTDDEFNALRNAPFLMRSGEGLPRKPQKE